MPLKTDDAGQPLVPTGIHWQLAQATSLQNLKFTMPKGKDITHVGIFTENSSGGFVQVCHLRDNGSIPSCANLLIPDLVWTTNWGYSVGTLETCDLTLTRYRSLKAKTSGGVPGASGTLREALNSRAQQQQSVKFPPLSSFLVFSPVDLTAC